MTASTRARPVGSARTTHRCDACGAPARVVVVLVNSGDLVFCEHHAQQYEAALKPIAVLVERLPESW